MAYRETTKVLEKKSQMRSEILRSAETLVRVGGFKALTIQALANDVNMSVGNIYRYFGNKDALSVEVFRHSTERELLAVAQAIQGKTDISQSLEAGVRVFAERAFRAPVLAWALIAEPVEPAVDESRLFYREAYARLFEKVIAEGVASGTLPQQIPALSAAAIVGALAESLLGPLEHNGPEQEVIDGLVLFCLRAVGA
ncbi:TetR/AcrR family transcriptional regulator [Spongiibacter sp. KMU-158]|uniref:TetR/AcrR family transcriptional regulator n=1 Tax=Spongiibacter pelagi TaxID=2760804 RepID=A0A927GW83_9GAMM|nr:TetR/AcrR family transcriptional regulator [Spongiibacter pelagi]MBD2859175.1 TetR/AcrR family transcriptional regulator [Spongiibacter pelagi]